MKNTKSPKERLDLSRVEHLVRLAIEEDLGPGDVTTEAVVKPHTMASGRLVAREDAVLAGLALAEYVFAEAAGKLKEKGIPIRMQDLSFEPRLADGEKAAKGDLIATLRGPAWPILVGERTALNFIQRLSGIATLTRRYVEAVAGTSARIMDTRKTTPGWRYLEKYAVRMGGGANHRTGLYDMVLIKDNHIRIAAEHWPNDNPIQRAVRAARSITPRGMLIEVEADTLDQVRLAIDAGADMVLLDNMSLEQMAEAVKLAKSSPRSVLTEASGGVTLERVAHIARIGVDRISIGALTHSARAVDIALDM